MVAVLFAMLPVLVVFLPPLSYDWSLFQAAPIGSATATCSVVRSQLRQTELAS